ncbi:MAG: replication initiator protein A [Oscillospiraceae bacterium]|nr:replication initiator protein A [Oscillospiraceae bacterium]MDE7171389.1 replication initiator protein A [Oscillospiraceae bacterium]
MLTFDYYYGGESDQFSFCRIPRQLITGKAFKGLSANAKLLYALMLERMGLSTRNGWYDEQGHVFIYYTINEIRAVLNCGNDKAIKLLAELDTIKGIGLIERVKQGQGRPTKIFVKNFSRQTSLQDDSQTPTANDKPTSNCTQDCGKAEVLTSENQQPRLPKNRSQDIGKPECNYIDMNYTYFSYINPSISNRVRHGQAALSPKPKLLQSEKLFTNRATQGKKSLTLKTELDPRMADSGAFGVAVTASTAFGSTNANLLGDGP